VIEGDADSVYPWASVTKLLTAYACLIAVEEGTASPDEPVDEFPDVTLGHLLAHAGGLAFDEAVAIGPPATKRQYSNASIRLAARHVEQRAAMPFGEYVRYGVLDPLHMSTVNWGDEAAGARGTIQDLVAFADELLAPALISPSTLELATRPWWPNLDGVLPGFGMQRPCPWGLGFEIKGSKTPHWTGRLCDSASFGHFGQSGAMLCVDPVAKAAWCWLDRRPFGPWAHAAWPSFIDSLNAV
jgi:CubicO group peptidase (beta-lactamase class C family)